LTFSLQCVDDVRKISWQVL